MRINTLVAGVGNVFLGDDGFGVEVAARLAREPLGENVRVVDVGVRARALAFELLYGGYGQAIIVDTVARGHEPGTVSLIDPAPAWDSVDAQAPTFDAHAMTLDAVFSFLAALGGTSARIWIVGCEPANLDEGMGLSVPVAAAVDQAVALVRDVLSGAVERSPDDPTPGRAAACA